MSVNPFSMLLNGPGYGVHSLLNALPDQVYVKDMQSRFVFVNTATAQYLKRPEKQTTIYSHIVWPMNFSPRKKNY